MSRPCTRLAPLALGLLALVAAGAGAGPGAPGPWPRLVRRHLARRRPPVPPLERITPERARALGAWARRLRVVAGGGAPEVVAWSMVNMACQDRALALEVALAGAPEVLDAPPVMVDTELTSARLQELVEHPGTAVATINVTGPLITEQTLLRADGTAVPGGPERRFWPYHHAVVLDAGSGPEVVDLSEGDEPVPIQSWLHGFVSPDVPCAHMEETEWWEVWGYWNGAFSGWVPSQRPPRVCGYTISPMFAFRWDQEPLFDFIATVPSTMVTQTGGFRTILAWRGVTLPDPELPLVTSRYLARTEADLCSWVDLPYCAGLHLVAATTAGLPATGP